MKYLILGCIFLFANKMTAQELFPKKGHHSVTNDEVDILLTGTSGETVFLNDYLKSEKNYLISIWATWCGPCVTELKEFQKHHKKWMDLYNVELVAISIDKPNDLNKIFDMYESKEWDFTVFHDAMGYTARELEIFGIPQSFLVNKKGQIIKRTKGYKVSLPDIYERLMKEELE